MTTDDLILLELTEAERDGYAPTTTDLAAWLECHRTTAYRALNRLEARGLIVVTSRSRTPKPILAKLAKPEPKPLSGI